MVRGARVFSQTVVLEGDVVANGESDVSDHEPEERGEQGLDGDEAGVVLGVDARMMPLCSGLN